MYYSFLKTPIGDLLLAGDEQGLSLVAFPEGSMRRDPEPEWVHSDKPFIEARAQLTAYFDGTLRDFDLPLKPDVLTERRELISPLSVEVQEPVHFEAVHFVLETEQPACRPLPFVVDFLWESNGDIRDGRGERAHPLTADAYRWFTWA